MRGSPAGEPWPGALEGVDDGLGDVLGVAGGGLDQDVEGQVRVGAPEVDVVDVVEEAAAVQEAERVVPQVGVGIDQGGGDPLPHLLGEEVGQ